MPGRGTGISARPATRWIHIHADVHAYAGNRCHSNCAGPGSSTARGTAYKCTACTSEYEVFGYTSAWTTRDTLQALNWLARRFMGAMGLVADGLPDLWKLAGVDESPSNLLLVPKVVSSGRGVGGRGRR